MSLLPTSNALVLPESVPNFQHPLPCPQSDCHAAVSQPIPRNAHPDSLLASGSLDNADPLTMFASRVPQGPVQNVVPSSHPFLANDQPSLNFVWPTTLPPPPDGPYQSLSTNQAAQAACTCPLCATDTPTVQPPRFAAVQPARVGQDLITAPPVAVGPSSSGVDHLAAASLPSAPPVPNAPVRYADAVDHTAGLFGLGQPTTDGGYARASERAQGGPSVWAPRRGRDVPFVRVEDRIEWVSRDLLKMTLWFNWSPDVEARAREHRDEPWLWAASDASSAGGVAGMPGGVASTSNVPVPRSTYL